MTSALYPQMVAMRGEHVHALRAGGARHQLDGKRGDVALGDLLNGGEAAERAEKSDEDLIFVEQREVGVAGFVVRAVAEDLRDDVGGAKNFGAIGDDFCAFGGVGGVGVAGFDSGVGFDDDFEAAFCQGGDDGRARERRGVHLDSFLAERRRS